MTRLPPPGVTAPVQPAEQLRYARWLERGARAGFVLLVLLFVAYATGLWSAQVPPDRLSTLWSLPVDAFRQAAGMPAGWQWLGLVHRADVANLIGIALLAGCSLPALVALVPLYAGRGERLFAALCMAQVAVLLFAAAGVIGGGH